MKKSLLTSVIILIGFISGHAQLADTTVSYKAPLDTSQLRSDKEALAKIEVKENEFTRKALLQIGVSDAVIAKLKQSAKEHNEKVKGLAKDQGTTKDKKFEKVIQSYKEKEDREREILGREKYDEYLRVLTMSRHLEGLNN